MRFPVAVRSSEASTNRRHCWFYRRASFASGVQTKLVRFERNDVSSVRIVMIDLKREPKIRRHPLAMSSRNFHHLATVESPMVLQKSRSGLKDGHDLVHTLSKLRIALILGQELRTHTNVARFPRLAAIVSAINPTRGDSDVHPLLVRWIGKDCMQAQAAASRLPLRSVRMIVETLYQRPCLARVIGSK